MLEKLFGRGVSTKAKVEEFSERVLHLFDGFPEQNISYPAVPSWAKINREDVEALSREALTFLDMDNEDTLPLRVYAHLEGDKAWVGIRTNNRQVRYLEENGSLSIVYESRVNEGEWIELGRVPTDDWREFERILQIGEETLKK